MTQYLLPVVQEEIADSSALDDLQVALDDMRSQLNRDSDVDTFFVKYTPTPSVVDTKPADFSGEREYLKNVLEEMHNNDEIDLWNGDLVVVVDSGVLGNFDLFGYGYGGAEWSPPGSSDVYTASRVLHTPSEPVDLDPVETFYNLAIHEAAHALTDRSIDGEGIDLDHASGTYDIESGIFAENGRDVSPLATAYTYADVVDTLAPGGSTPPDEFCGGISNEAADKWCGSFIETCRHTTEMVNCTKGAIDDGTPLG